MQPPANSFVSLENLDAMERFYPLHAFVCSACFLVQLEAFETPAEIFSEYPYYSSFSSSWLEAARCYADAMTERLGLGAGSLVVEIGSNDGYLLQHFKGRSIPVLGIDPARNCAEAAAQLGIETLVTFFGADVARDLMLQGKAADLIVANNVMAHVPDLNDFVAGIKTLLKPGGVATIEVPHLQRLIDRVEYDTIYHEHFSYFSAGTARRVFAAHGLEMVDVEELPTHGGSIRMWVMHAGAPAGERVGEILARERSAGLASLPAYGRFAEAVIASKLALWQFVVGAKREGKTIAGYGAAAKGNTLLNSCGIRSDVVSYVVDRNPYKQGRFLPGSHIPVHPVERLAETRPDYVLILPWNIADEIVREMAVIREWGGRFVVPIPQPSVRG